MGGALVTRSIPSSETNGFSSVQLGVQAIERLGGGSELLHGRAYKGSSVHAHGATA